MVAALSGQWAPYLAFFAAVIASWKAADLLEADNALMACLFGAAFALVGPFVVGDLITEVLAGAPDPGDGVKSLSGFAPKIAAFGARFGFALVGVLCWCGFERAR
ncbi:MAG: hypothetical protein ACKVP7_05395 [Hyphomicrobiaceae bacterium]